MSAPEACPVCGHRYRRRLIKERPRVWAWDGPIPTTWTPGVWHACTWCVGRLAQWQVRR